MALYHDKQDNDYILYCSLFSYDLFLKDYYTSRKSNYEELFMLFLLRFRVISRKQSYLLDPACSRKYVDRITGALAKNDRISRIMGDSAESTYAKSVQELYYTITTKGINDIIYTAESLYSAWASTTAQRYSDARILKSGVTVIEGIHNATERVTSHFCHTAYSKNLFIEYIKSASANYIFEYQDEAVYGAGRYYSFYEKRATGVNIRTKAVRSDSVLKIEFQNSGIKENLYLLQELDTTKQRISVIEQKLLRYTHEVFDSWSVYERHMPILYFNVVTSTTDNQKKSELTLTEKHFIESLLLSEALSHSLMCSNNEPKESTETMSFSPLMTLTLRGTIDTIKKAKSELDQKYSPSPTYKAFYSTYLSRCLKSLNSLARRFPENSSLASLYFGAPSSDYDTNTPSYKFNKRFLVRYKNIEKAVLDNSSLSSLAYQGLSVCVTDNNDPAALQHLIPSNTPLGDKILSILAKKQATECGLSKEEPPVYILTYSPTENFCTEDSSITFRNVYHVTYKDMPPAVYAIEDYTYDFLSRLRIEKYLSSPSLWNQVTLVCIYEPLITKKPDKITGCEAITFIKSNEFD